MTSWEDYSFGETLPNVLVPKSIEPSRPKKRFIVEPQVLNAALELDVQLSQTTPPPHTVSNGIQGGLPPPPRPHSRKDRPHRSSPVSPASSGNPSIASIPSSPLSSPYSNPPDTPTSPGPGFKPSPRLSVIFRGEPVLFSSPRRQSFSSLRRRSVVDHEDELYRRKGEDQAPVAFNVPPWSHGDHGELGSPQGSIPSSPEMGGVPTDGSRSGRHRYLSGLHKITKLGKSKGSISEFGVRSGRRMSDAEVDPRQTVKKGSEELSASSRYRRMLDRGVKTAGELMKGSTSVPNSTMVQNVVDRDEDGSANAVRREGFKANGFSGGGGPSATQVSAVATKASPIQVQPRLQLSHAWLSSSSSPDSSHEPPSASSSSDPRISISSTIYPDSPNSLFFHKTHYPRPSMSSPVRDSFIDLASPSFSPRSPEFNSRFPISHHEHSEQPRSLHSNDSVHGKSSPRLSYSPSRSGSNPPLARVVPSAAGLEKPPIPTAPKPDFTQRSRSSNTKASSAHSKKPGPLANIAAEVDASLPTTFTASNALTPRERAGRIRTTRKLAQLLGQPPGVPTLLQERHSVVDIDLSNGCMPLPAPLGLNLSAKRRLHRPAASMSVSDDVAGSTTPVVYNSAGGMVWPPPEGTRYVSLAPRRHSAPLSPDEVSFMAGRKSHDTDFTSTNSYSDDDGRSSVVIEIGSAQGGLGHGYGSSESGSNAGSSRRSRVENGPGSPLSFMDLSDEEGTHDGGTVETPRASRGRSSRLFSPSTASLADSLSSEQLADDERRRKREKLAKLHRFLGSRVPPHLVLGPLDEGIPLPPPAPPLFDSAAMNSSHDVGDLRKIMRRRRSSSATELSRTWSDDIDRLKEDLNDREKALNVRRAVKMEKMFGVAPPQTLYHTRASSPNISSHTRQPSPSAKALPKSPGTPPFRFTAAGISSKQKTKKRPGTADSSEPLIDARGFLDIGQSSVYMHYRHSLNSLNDIIERDDKESLAELHDYLTGSAEHYMTGEGYDFQFGPSAALGPVSPFPDDFTTLTTTSSPKAERRRSLPSRVSIASLTSEMSTIVSPTAPAPEEETFQQRRRRAAKLTHFFGVDYRTLMSEILESIEKGLEEERGKGTLRPDEVRDLQQTLVSLKTKRNSLSR